MRLSSQVRVSVVPDGEAGYVKKEFVNGSYEEIPPDEDGSQFSNISGFSTAIEEYQLSAYSYPGYIFDYWVTEYSQASGATSLTKGESFERYLSFLKKASAEMSRIPTDNWQTAVSVCYISPPKKQKTGGGSASFSEYKRYVTLTAVYVETVILMMVFEHGKIHLTGRMKNRAMEVTEESELSVFGNVEFRIDTVATITAIPDTGYYFAGFTGDIEGKVNGGRVMMNTDKNITAIFKPMAKVTINIIGNGSVI